MKECNFLQTYEIFLKLIYLKLLQEYLNNEIIGFTDKLCEEESVYYTVTDIQGSITEVYDGSRKLVWKSGYTAFGELAGETVDLIDFDGMYTGCDYDAEIGLTYHWNRWRSEDGSCFISEDPARDGANWYGYAGCNPMVYVDRIGLFASNGFLGPYAAEQYNTTPEVGPQPNPNATPQNHIPNITGRGPSGMPEGVSPNLSQTNSNLYHYAGNNPIKYVDLDGRQTDNSTEEKVTWTADEVLFMTGMQITFLNSGMTMMTGTATVIFSNGKESFEKEFEVISTYSEGIFCTIGESVSYTHYTKEFPANATKQDVIDSYEGIFQTESISFSLGSLFSAGGGKTYSVNSSTKEIDYTGWMGTTGAGGAGIGCEKLRFTLGAQVTAYRDPEKPNNNWEDHPEWFYNMPFIK